MPERLSPRAGIMPRAAADQFESMQVCGSCYESNTGDMTDSHWAGCKFCDGIANRYREI